MWKNQSIAAGLPIGSGAIESTNKSLIQQKIKIPGALWKIDNTDHMIRLRAMIANGHWNVIGRIIHLTRGYYTEPQKNHTPQSLDIYFEPEFHWFML